MIATFQRLALVPVLSALILAGATPWTFAQDTGEGEAGVSENAAAGEDFLPPLTGAPEKRMGAASRELGRPVLPCGYAEGGTEGAHAQDCADQNATLPEPQNGKLDGAAQ